MDCQVQHSRDPMGSANINNSNEGCHPTASLMKEILQLEEAGLEKSLHASCLHCIETEAPTSAPSPFLQHLRVDTPLVCVLCKQVHTGESMQQRGGGNNTKNQQRSTEEARAPFQNEAAVPF